MKISLLFVLALIFVSKQVISQERNGQQKISVTVHWKQATINDTLYLTITNPVQKNENLIELISEYRDGKYTFETNVDDLNGIFYIKKRRTVTDIGGTSRFDLLTKKQLWSVGDSIDFNFSHYNEGGIGSTSAIYIVSGKGALKYNLAKDIDSILTYSHDVATANCEDPGSLFENPFTTQQEAAINHLNKFKTSLSKNEFNILKANIDYFNGNHLFNSIANCFIQMPSNIKERFLLLYEKQINNLLPRPIEDSILLNSNYIDFLYSRYANESKIRFAGASDFTWLYQKIRQNEQGRVRDRLIALLFIKLRKPQDIKPVIEDALAFVREKYSLALISEYHNQSNGKELKDFTVLDTAGRHINISDFKGKIVVIDFWTIGCGACSLLYENVISRVKQKLKKPIEVAFISVSADGNKQRWLKGIESGMFTSKDAINLNTGNLSMNHPALINNGIKALPTVVLLNREGRIVRFNTSDLYTEEGMTAAIQSALSTDDK